MKLSVFFGVRTLEGFRSVNNGDMNEALRGMSESEAPFGGWTLIWRLQICTFQPDIQAVSLLYACIRHQYICCQAL